MSEKNLYAKIQFDMLSF